MNKSIKNMSWILIKSYLITMSISLFFGVFLFQMILQREGDYRFKVGDMEALNTVSYFITKHMEESEKISFDLATNLEVQGALVQNDEEGNRIISRTLKDSLIGRNNIRSIHIVNKNGKLISEFKTPNYTKNDIGFIRQLDLKSIDEKKGKCYWGVGNNVLEYNRGDTLYMGRLIRSKSSLEPLGYVLVYLDHEQFKADCAEIIENINFQVAIQGRDGNLFYMLDDFERGLLEKIETWEDGVYDYIKVGNEKYYYLIKDMPVLEGKILGINTEPRSNNMKMILSFAVLINIIFITMSSNIIGKKVISPLKYIANKARDIGREGKLNTEFAIDEGYEEVYDIVHALNEMMAEIKELVSEVAEREKLQKRLELSIINHQVKPHFLYNTLNAASILVAMEEKEEANELIKTLAKYYRACLGGGEDAITIEDELEIVREYIKIAVIRNPNIVEMTYDIDEAALGYRIPKITLQSLVENSIKYGIKKLGQPVRIHVSVKVNEEEKVIELSVEDDGSGMSQEMIDKVMLGEKLEVKSGFGLKAIITRILLCYDVKSVKEVINITSKCGEYTKIKIKIPL